MGSGVSLAVAETFANCETSNRITLPVMLGSGSDEDGSEGTVAVAQTFTHPPAT